MLIQIQPLKEKITGLLTFNKSLRDNDLELLANIWWSEAQTLQSKGDIPSASNLLAFYFFRFLREGKFSNPESVRRCRQMIQENNPHLRGEKYDARHKHSENITEEIYQPENSNQLNLKL
jgi:hypothetical protein